jgi:rod shape-determining protein MreD
VRSFLALAVAAAVAMLLQTTVIPSVPWLPVLPDLILVLAVHVAIRHPGAGGVLGAFLLGAFLDAFAGTVAGVNAFAMTAVYLAARLVSRRLWTESGVPLMAVVFFAACVRAVAGAAVQALVAAQAPLWQHVVRFGFLEAGAAAVVAPPVFVVVGRMKRLVGAT